jgi:hypothetical protein
MPAAARAAAGSGPSSRALAIVDIQPGDER